MSSLFSGLSIYGHHSAMMAQANETPSTVTAGLSRHFDDAGSFLSPPPPEYGNIVTSVTSSASPSISSSSAASPYYSYPSGGSYSSVCHASQQQQANLYAAYSSAGSSSGASLPYPASLSPSVAQEYYVGMFDRDAGTGYGGGLIPSSNSPNAVNHGYSMASPPPPPVYAHPSSLEQSPSSASRGVTSADAAAEAGWHPSPWSTSHPYHHGAISGVESFHIPGFASQSDAELALSGNSMTSLIEKLSLLFYDNPCLNCSDLNFTSRLGRA